MTDRLLKPSEVAAIFSVNVKTVNRWCDAGKLDHIRTPSGRRRIRESSVRARLEVRRPEGASDAEVRTDT